MNTVLFFIFVCITQIAYAGSFDGHWRFDDPCAANGYGVHYSVTLKMENPNKYVGSWEESTNNRGWTGLLRGHMQGSKLSLSRCIESEASSWSIENSESCPNYKPIGVFVRDGDELLLTSTTGVWPAMQSFTKVAQSTDKSPPNLYTCQINED